MEEEAIGMTSKPLTWALGWWWHLLRQESLKEGNQICVVKKRWEEFINFILHVWSLKWYQKIQVEKSGI